MAKNRAHLDNCRAQGIILQPLVVETFGGWDQEAVNYLKDIARLGARRWGKSDALKTKHFFFSISTQFIGTLRLKLLIF